MMQFLHHSQTVLLQIQAPLYKKHIFDREFLFADIEQPIFFFWELQIV